MSARTPEESAYEAGRQDCAVRLIRLRFAPGTKHRIAGKGLVWTVRSLYPGSPDGGRVRDVMLLSDTGRANLTVPTAWARKNLRAAPKGK